MKVAAWLVALPAVLACSPGDSTTPALPAPLTTSLPAGVVATVGSILVASNTVALVASAQHIQPREALELLIREAVLAQGAKGAGLDRAPGVEAAIRGVLGRAVLEGLKRDANAEGPSDAEVAEATARHFVELDRPEAFRVIQVVVRVAEGASDAKKARARALAERFADRVSKASDEAEFRALAESVTDRGDLEVVIEALKPVAADGRVVDIDRPQGDETYDAHFARAAARLAEPGQKSGVFATQFGFHTIMLLARTPPHRVPDDERRQLLHDEIITERAKRLRKERLDLVKSTVETSVERSAPSLLATVDVGKYEAP